MPLFRRRGQPAPGWSPFGSDDEWRAFADAVRADTARRGWSAHLEEGLVVGGETRYGLTNLAQMCLAHERAVWPDTVRGHFDRMVAMPTDKEFASAEEARGAMKARLLDDGFMSRVTWEPAGRRVADDLWLVIAYDLPDAVLIPRREEILEWGDEEDLLELAIAHARAEPGLELEGFAVEGSPVSVLTGDSFFTATHALWADAFAPPPSEHGTLVVVPTRNLVIAHAIRDGSVLGMIDPLLQIAARYHQEGPGSLSDAVYWLRDGELERLNAWLDANGSHIAPSDAFTAMLNRVP